MSDPLSVSLVTAILGAGGLATVFTVITKYWLDKKKLEDSGRIELIVQLQDRIVQLEKENRECLQRYAELSQKVGYLEGSIRYLEQKLEKYQ